MDEIKKILVIQTAFIGDVVWTLPLISALKGIYSSAEIDVVVSPQCTKLLENNPAVNRVYVLDKKKKGLLNSIRLIQQLRSVGYDLSIAPHSSLRSGLIVFFSKIKTRLGFKRNFQRFLLTQSIVFPKKIHKISKFLTLLHILPVPHYPELDPSKLEPNYLFPSKEENDKALRLIDSFNQKNGSFKPIIVIVPGSLWFTKKWPLEKYVQLSKELIKNDYLIILAGSYVERGMCDYISQCVTKAYPEKSECIRNIAGNFNLLEFAAVVKKAQLVLCNDSGSLHLSNAVGTPVFAFYGPTERSVGSFPYREFDHVFEVDIPCRPCGTHGGHKCSRGHFNCMMLIEVDTVLDKVNRFFV